MVLSQDVVNSMIRSWIAPSDGGDGGAALKAWIDAGGDVNDYDASGSPLLHRANTGLMAGAHALIDVSRVCATIKMLIAAGADVRRVDSRGLTALVRATHLGLAEAVVLLLDAGYDVDFVPPEEAQVFASGFNATPLLHAAVGGQAALVDLFLRRGARVDATARKFCGCAAAQNATLDMAIIYECFVGAPASWDVHIIFFSVKKKKRRRPAARGRTGSGTRASSSSSSGASARTAARRRRRRASSRGSSRSRAP